MANSFFLLILPMRTLTIHLGSHQGNMGLSLRGDCATAADASHLDQAIGQLLDSKSPQVWVDCQQLHSLTWLGQRALLKADSRTRAGGIPLYWCGLATSMLTQLAASGLNSVLNLLPAEGFRGPRFLLPNLTSPTAHQLAW